MHHHPLGQRRRGATIIIKTEAVDRHLAHLLSFHCLGDMIRVYRLESQQNIDAGEPHQRAKPQTPLQESDHEPWQREHLFPAWGGWGWGCIGDEVGGVGRACW